MNFNSISSLAQQRVHDLRNEAAGVRLLRLARTRAGDTDVATRSTGQSSNTFTSFSESSA